jgi:hypothetical protein
MNVIKYDMPDNEQNVVEKALFQNGLRVWGR